MSASPSISLIVSTYQSPLALEKVFRGLERQTLRPTETLISDDGSGEPTRQLIESWTARLGLKHVWHDDIGFRKTIILNKCLAVAKGDYLVQLDGDCVPHPDFIKDHAALAEKNFWVQGRRCFVKEEFVPQFDPANISLVNWFIQGRISGLAKLLRLPFPIIKRNRQHRGIIGCNMGFWRDDLMAVNGFDEEYTGWGIGEDSDLGARLYNLGRTRKFVYGWAMVYHLNHKQASKSHVAASHQRLSETISSGKIRCARGVDQYL